MWNTRLPSALLLKVLRITYCLQSRQKSFNRRAITRAWTGMPSVYSSLKCLSVDRIVNRIMLSMPQAGYPPFFTEDGNPMKLYEKVCSSL